MIEVSYEKPVMIRENKEKPEEVKERPPLQPLEPKYKEFNDPHLERMRRALEAKRAANRRYYEKHREEVIMKTKDNYHRKKYYPDTSQEESFDLQKDNTLTENHRQPKIRIIRKSHQDTQHK